MKNSNSKFNKSDKVNYFGFAAEITKVTFNVFTKEFIYSIKYVDQQGNRNGMTGVYEYDLKK